MCSSTASRGSAWGALIGATDSRAGKRSELSDEETTDGTILTAGADVASSGMIMAAEGSTFPTVVIVVIVGFVSAVVELEAEDRPSAASLSSCRILASISFIFSSISWHLRL